jgi:hypothetical protein
MEPMNHGVFTDGTDGTDDLEKFVHVRIRPYTGMRE